MATFYYNPYSGESINSQWRRHLQADAYIRSVADIIAQNRREFEDTFKSASAEQRRSIEAVCGNIDRAFAGIAEHFQKLNSNISALRSEISELASMLDWKLSLLIEEQRLTNQLLGHIGQLLRIPDIQKVRIYHIEQGLKFLVSALQEGPGSEYYADALAGLRAAETIENKDYITLNRIGLIHLVSENVRDFTLAKKYFLLAAKYALVESRAHGTTTSNYMRPAGYTTDTSAADHYMAAATDSYLYAARACYLLRELPEAAELAGKAYQLTPSYLTAGFEHAKYLAAANREVEAVSVLEGVISSDRLFAAKIAVDGDLGPKPSIVGLLEACRTTALVKARTGVNTLERTLKGGSAASDVVTRIEGLTSRGDFLSAMQALDALGLDYRLPLKHYWLYDKKIGVSESSPPMTLMAFAQAERESDALAESLIAKAKKELVQAGVWIGALTGAGVGAVVGLCAAAETSAKYAAIEGCGSALGVWFGVIVGGCVVGCIIGYLSGAANEPRMFQG